MLPLGLKSSCGNSVKSRFIEFFVFDYDCIPYLLSLFFWFGVTFPLVALDKIEAKFVRILREMGISH